MSVDQRPRIAVVVRRPPIAGEAIAVARALEADGRFLPVVVTDRTGFAYMDEEAKARFSFVTMTGVPIVPHGGESRVEPGPKERVIADMLTTRVPLVAFARSLRAHWNARRQARALLDSVRPAAVVVFDDRAPGHPLMLVHEGRTRGIPALFLPFAASTVESDLFLRQKKVAHQVDKGPDTLTKRLVAAVMPRHVLRSETGRFLFFPWPTMAALALFGVRSTRPWVMGGGEAALVGLVSDEERVEVVGHGVDAERVRLIGQPSTDALFHALAERDALRDRLGVPADARVIVCAVPQTAEHGMADWREHVVTSQRLFEQMTATGATVLLSLHPKSHPSTYAGAAEAAGARIVDLPLADLLPAADIFVANFSSTVRWAAALGIPTVLVDLSRFRYTMYDVLTAIPKVEIVNDVGPLVRRFVDDEDFRRATGETLRAQAMIYSTLDGQVGRRVVEALADLVEPVSKRSEVLCQDA